MRKGINIHVRSRKRNTLEIMHSAIWCQLGAGQVLGEVQRIHLLLLSFPRYKLVLEKGSRQEGPLGWCYHCSQTRQISDSEVPHSIGRSRSPCATIKPGPVGQHSLQEGLLVFPAWAGLEGKAAGCSPCFHPSLHLHFVVLQVNGSREAQNQGSQIDPCHGQEKWGGF